jgi:hypothetical protein
VKVAAMPCFALKSMTRLRRMTAADAFYDGAARHDQEPSGHFVMEAQRSHFVIQSAPSACGISAKSYEY